MSERTRLQKFANDVDLQLHRQWHRLLMFDQAGTVIFRNKHDAMRSIRNDIENARAKLRLLMHPTDVKETSGAG